MTHPIVYPLKQIIEVKQKRVEEAEKVLKEKQRLLDLEIEKLKTREAERDRVKKHKEEKLRQLRETMDAESISTTIQQMKVYLKIVEEKLKIEEKKVQDQKELVKTAEKNVAQAKSDLQKKRQEVDKLAMHQADWEREKRKELELIEGREQDELGSLIHTAKHYKVD